MTPEKFGNCNSTAASFFSLAPARRRQMFFLDLIYVSSILFLIMHLGRKQNIGLSMTFLKMRTFVCFGRHVEYGLEFKPGSFLVSSKFQRITHD